MGDGTNGEKVMWGAAAGVIIVFLALFLWEVLAEAGARREIDAILGSDDPVGNLILALDSKSTNNLARTSLDEIGDPLLLALAPVCDGLPMRRQRPAAAYDPDAPGPHPLVLLHPDGKSDPWTYRLLADWGPASREAPDVQLVVCVVRREHRLELCEYGIGNHSVKRIQHRIYLEVREARTGALIAKETLMGSEPSRCPGTVRSSHGHKTYTGRAIELSRARKYLAAFYE